MTDQALLIGTVRLMVARGWDTDECARALMQDFGLTDEQARTALREATRQRQEIDIADTHDDITESHQ